MNIEDLKNPATSTEEDIKETTVDVETETQEESTIVEDTSEEDTIEDVKTEDESKETKEEPTQDPEDAEFENELEKLLDDEEEGDEEYKKVIKERIKPVTNAVDLSSFTISTKPISMSNALKVVSLDFTADWVLPNAKKIISMKEFKGSELAKLNPNNYSKGRYEAFKSIYKIIFDHIANKEENLGFETWLKTFNFFDLDHLFFAVYKASFAGSNTLPYSCTAKECNHTYMADFDFDAMVKYKNDDIKKECEKIMNGEVSAEDGVLNTEAVQVSDDYVFAFKCPSIYNIIFETALLDREFIEKYNDIITIIAHIESIFYINREKQELQKIEIKTNPKSEVKTIKEKIVRMGKIINSLTSDQYNFISSIVDKIEDDHKYIEYVVPASTCPKCGKEIEERETSAEGLLFMRHQLMTTANS